MTQNAMKMSLCCPVDTQGPGKYTFHESQCVTPQTIPILCEETDESGFKTLNIEIFKALNEHIKVKF